MKVFVIVAWVVVGFPAAAFAQAAIAGTVTDPSGAALRIAKILKVRGTRSTLALDLYNALNSGAVLAYNSAYAPGFEWLQPMTLTTRRFVRISAETEF